MRNSAAMSAALAWPFLLPGNLARNVMGMGETEYPDLVRMLVDLLLCTSASVLVVALTV